MVTLSNPDDQVMAQRKQTLLIPTRSGVAGNAQGGVVARVPRFSAQLPAYNRSAIIGAPALRTYP